ncbi:MAG: hypothetical protein EHM91_09000, partial [Planctomycetota bacterium]
MAEDDPSGETFILTDEPGTERKSFKRHRRINVWKSFLRHKRLALLTLVGVIAVAEPVLYFRSVRPVYRAEALLTVAPVMMKNVIEDREYHIPRYDELVNEQLNLVVREEITLDALERLKEDRAFWMRPDESRRDAANRLSSTLNVRRVPDSTYISIALEGSTPQGLDKIVNTVVEAYMARVKNKGMYGQEVREETLQQRKTELQEEIRKKTDQLSAWAKELGVAGFEKPLDGASVETKSLFEARSRLKDAEARYEAMKVRNEVLRKADLTGEARDLVATDPEVVSLKTVLLPRKNEFRAKAMGLPPEHEGKKEIDRLIAEINGDLERSEKSALERIRLGLIQRRDIKLTNELDLVQSDVDQARRYEKTLDEELRNQTGKTARFNSIYYEALNVRQEVERLNRQLSALEDRLDAMRLEAQRPGFVTLVAPAR